MQHLYHTSLLSRYCAFCIQKKLTSKFQTWKSTQSSSILSTPCKSSFQSKSHCEYALKTLRFREATFNMRIIVLISIFTASAMALPSSGLASIAAAERKIYNSPANLAREAQDENCNLPHCPSTLIARNENNEIGE